MERTGNSRDMHVLRVEGRELEVHGMYEMEEWRKVYLEQLGKSIEHT